MRGKRSSLGFLFFKNPLPNGNDNASEMLYLMNLLCIRMIITHPFTSPLSSHKLSHERGMVKSRVFSASPM
jgi:hypothetical protein